MEFEPTRAEHIGLAVQRLNHSATSSHASRIENSSCYHGVTTAATSLLKASPVLCGDFPTELKNLHVKWK